MKLHAASSIHVMHVITGLGVGGAEMALLRLIGSKASPLRHTVVSMLPGGALGPRFHAAGVAVFWLDFRSHPVASFFALRRHMQTMRPDIVQTWMYHADFAGGLTARLCGIKSVIWGIRQSSIEGVSAGLPLRMLYRACAWLSSRVPRAIVCCAHAAQVSHVAFGYAAGKMRVIQNGFDTEKLAPCHFDRPAARRSFGLEPSEVVIGHVARFSPEKDHLTFLDAARLALQQFPTLRFMMIGRGVDVDNKALADAIRSFKLEQAMLLLGERDDVPACLAAMDIFCLSSRFEGFPNVLGEAMAMCIPSVTTDAGDARAIAGTIATVVPCGDAPALAAEFVRLASLEPGERHLIGAQCRARITTTFGLAEMRSRFDALYADISSNQD